MKGFVIQRLGGKNLYKRGGRMHVKQPITGVGVGQKIVRR